MFTVKHMFYWISTALIVLLCVFCLPWSQHYWLAAAALASLYITHQKIVVHRKELYICAGIVTALLAAAGGTLAGYLLWLGCFLFFTTLATILIGMLQPHYWRQAFVINIFAVMGCIFPATAMEALQRYCYVLSGILIVSILRVVFFQRSSQREINAALANTLKAAAALSQTIFNFYLSRDFHTTHFNFERQWHSDNSKFLKYLQQARVLQNHYRGKLDAQYKIVMIEIEQLHEILMAMSLLIDRVEDHTTFEVATKEFTRLSTSVVAYLHAFIAQLAKQKYAYPEDFFEAVSELQEVNNDALQVVAREPIVFLLFIQDFFALNDIFIQLGDAVADVA